MPINKIKNLSGHKEIVRLQGSASLALEIITLNFLYGKVLIVSTGYYSNRLIKLIKYEWVIKLNSVGLKSQLSHKM